MFGVLIMRSSARPGSMVSRNRQPEFGQTLVCSDSGKRGQLVTLKVAWRVVELPLGIVTVPVSCRFPAVP